MGEEPKKETPAQKPAPAPALIDIVNGKRRRQCAKADFPFFKERGFSLVDTGPETSPAGADPKTPPVKF